MTLEMDADHRVPVLLGDVETHPVTQDPGIVDQHVQVAIGVDRLLDEPLGTGPVRDVVPVDNRFAACVTDQLRGLLSRCRIRSEPGAVATKIVDNDPGALGREPQGLLPSDAPARPGNDGHLAVQ